MSQKNTNTKPGKAKLQPLTGKIGVKSIHVMHRDGYWVIKGASGIVGAVLGEPITAAREIAAASVRQRPSDKEALRSDWEAIGNDIRVATEKQRKEIGVNK